jgi:hypothetical protein
MALLQTLGGSDQRRRGDEWLLTLCCTASAGGLPALQSSGNIPPSGNIPRARKLGAEES